MISSAGKGFLRAANPRNSDVSPMEVIGSCVIHMVFSPVDRVFRISFRIVRDLLYAVVLGVAFMKARHSTISFRDKEGFRPTTESTRVSFSSHTTNSATSSKDVTAAWTSFCAVRPPADNAPNPDDPRHVILKCLAEANEDSLDQVADHLRSICWTIKERRRSNAATVNTSRNALRKEERRRQQAVTEAAIARTETAPAPASQPSSNRQPGEEFPTPSQKEADSPTIADGAVWEDEGTLDWVLRLSNAVSSLPDGTSVHVDTRIKGPQPQTRLLVIVEPREKFNLKRGVDIGIPRGIQWWQSGNPRKCKVTNVATGPIPISKGVPVATVYSVNIFDTPGIQSPLKPLPQTCTGDEMNVLNAPERQAESRELAQQNNLDEANIGQLSPTEKEALMKVLEEYVDVFAANPEVVTAWRGPPMRLELKDPNSAPYVVPMRHYTPEQRKMIQAEIEKLHKAGAIVPSTSQYASCCHTMRKNNEIIRVVQDFRGLNALLKAQSGGLGDFLTIYDEIDHTSPA